MKKKHTGIHSYVLVNKRTGNLLTENDQFLVFATRQVARDCKRQGESVKKAKVTVTLL